MPIQSLDAQQFAAHLASAAATLSLQLQHGETVTRSAVNIAMSEAFGSTSRDGIWTQRDGFQACEIAMVMARTATNLSADPLLALDWLEAMEAE